MTDDSGIRHKLLYQVIVETEPITRIRTEILDMSTVLYSFAEAYINTSSKYDYCVLVLNSEGIPHRTWEWLNQYVINEKFKTDNDDEYMLDDVLYILNKYNIIATEKRGDRLGRFIKNQLLKNNIFKRMICIDSNRSYYHSVMLWINYILYKTEHDDKKTLLENLPKQMLVDITIIHMNELKEKAEEKPEE